MYKQTRLSLWKVPIRILLLKVLGAKHQRRWFLEYYMKYTCTWARFWFLIHWVRTCSFPPLYSNTIWFPYSILLTTTVPAKYYVRGWLKFLAVYSAVYDNIKVHNKYLLYSYVNAKFWNCPFFSIHWRCVSELSLIYFLNPNVETVALSYSSKLQIISFRLNVTFTSQTRQHDFCFYKYIFHKQMSLSWWERSDYISLPNSSNLF